jgi:hypothetical protein
VMWVSGLDVSFAGELAAGGLAGAWDGLAVCCAVSRAAGAVRLWLAPAGATKQSATAKVQIHQYFRANSELHLMQSPLTADS